MASVIQNQTGTNALIFSIFQIIIRKPFWKEVYSFSILSGKCRLSEVSKLNQHSTFWRLNAFLQIRRNFKFDLKISRRIVIVRYIALLINWIFSFTHSSALLIFLLIRVSIYISTNARVWNNNVWSSWLDIADATKTKTTENKKRTALTIRKVWCFLLLFYDWFYFWSSGYQPSQQQTISKTNAISIKTKLVDVLLLRCFEDYWRKPILNDFFLIPMINFKN